MEKDKVIWFVGAHFDDIEIGCGGTAAKLIEAGNRCHATIVTKSGYRDEKGITIRENNVAREEGLKGLATLGFEDVSTLDFETGSLSHDLPLIHALEAQCKLLQPDIVFTHWVHDVHQDHKAIAHSTLTVCRKAGSVLMYRPNWYRTNEPFRETLFVDVTTQYDKKLAAIQCHVSEVTKFGKHWEEFIVAQDIARGMEIGVAKAESFEVVKLKW